MCIYIVTVDSTRVCRYGINLNNDPVKIKDFFQNVKASFGYFGEDCRSTNDKILGAERKNRINIAISNYSTQLIYNLPLET